jgi:hypothetical protein
LARRFRPVDVALRDLYRHFFEPEARPDAPDSAKTKAMAHDLVRLSEGAYLPILMHWIESQAQSPIHVGEHHYMVGQAARAEAFREMRERLLRDIERAKAILTDPTNG